MAEDNGKFIIRYPDQASDATVLDKEAILLGRLASCDVVLAHKSVSRIHAGINFLDSMYFLINLSVSNALTLNGRLLGPKETDILADGDLIQIGPFLITARQDADELELLVHRQSSSQMKETTHQLPPLDAILGNRVKKEQADVLKVFWKKRTREREDWGSRLRPTGKPQPGKAVINWKPTGDLRHPWRTGLFVWAIFVIGALGVFAFMRYPETYAPKPLSGPHSRRIESSPIAIRENATSCMTCHMPTLPMEQACISCHKAEEFHASNTRAHEEAGITCTSCHKEHNGRDFSMTVSAIQSCAECHNDRNKTPYNGKFVRTPHGGSNGHPVEAGEWRWKGVYKEIAEAIPEINGSATGDANEQARLSRHFHSIHVARLRVPEGMKGDANGLVSCSTCHAGFNPIDRETPRQTCGICHTTRPGTMTADIRFAAAQVNCISCHVQHPYSSRRWSEFLSEDALKRRNDAVAGQIKQLNSK